MATVTTTKSSSAKRKGALEGKTSSSNKKFKANGSGASQQHPQQLSSTGQKRALKHERQSHRKHADSVTASKEVWNRLRQKSNSPEDTQKLMEELMDLIRGKVPEIALQHDASRVVQAAVQFGTPEQKREVVTELCAPNSASTSGNLLAELSKVQYAHFVVLKMIKYCHRDDDCVRMIVKSLKGSIPKLAVHAVGARVVELLFSTVPQKETAMLKQEFYGPHFALFASDVNSNDSAAKTNKHPTLQSNLEQVPDKKDVTLEFIASTLHKGMDKGLFGFVYFQQLLSEYMDVASPNDVRTMAPSIVDHSIHLLSTRTGTRVVVACASYGTAKDRKRILKSLKGYTRSSLLHRDAYLAILRLVQVTDDTVSVNKNLVQEILTLPKEDVNGQDNKSPLLDIALSETGSKLFLMLLVEDAARLEKYLDPYERDLLPSNTFVIENGQEVPTSKKNAETRRKELLQHVQKPLVDMCSRHAKELVVSIEGSRVLREVYASLHPQELVTAVLDACEASVDGSDAKEESEEDKVSVFEDPVGHRTIKTLFLCDAENDSSSVLFAREFVDRFDGSKLLDIGKSSSRGAFVLAALLKVKCVHDVVVKELSKHKQEIQKLAKGKKPTAGFEALLHALGNHGGSTSAKKKKRKLSR